MVRDGRQIGWMAFKPASGWQRALVVRELFPTGSFEVEVTVFVRVP